MPAEYNRVENTLIIAPVGEIDHHEAKFLRTEMDRVIFESAPEEVVFDLSRTTFMDSSGLGLILGRFRKAGEVGIGFTLVNPGEKILKILQMAGVDKLIQMKGVGK